MGGLTPVNFYKLFIWKFNNYFMFFMIPFRGLTP